MNANAIIWEENIKELNNVGNISNVGEGEILEISKPRNKILWKQAINKTTNNCIFQ